MNQQQSVLGILAPRGPGAATPSDLGVPVAFIDPSGPLWTNEFFRSNAGVRSAILFIPSEGHNPLIGQGTQLDELLPEPSPSVAVVTLPTHVTGVLAAIRDSSQLLPQRARFVAQVRQHARRSYAGAWVKRVGHLSHPAPSVIQHLASWSPITGGKFATLTPASAVSSMPASPTTPVEKTTVRVLRTSATVPPPVQGKLTAAYSPTHQEILAAGHSLRARWGTEASIEYVMTPDPRGMRLPAPDGHCGTCGDPVWQACPFCHLRGAVQEAPETGPEDATA
ncbi:hypothetical protein [Leekyejoonella antrihumi]|uniref:Uncharacterized protein n=1 Tax=Leekyejoonella antrihumi TaxID=1660198 RepID=A0A563E0N7_9MICO|nr:hypothetical protein [Leekyejoonella antrihumi]TWP35939.1 hypothetical protein FGL98_11955 [Leekyejoonella antrihumi]